MPSERPQGKLERLRIGAYLDPNRLGAPLAEFEAMYNPSSYSLRYANDFHQTKAQGSAGSESKFAGRSARECSFEFVLDATNASKPAVINGLTQSIPFLAVEDPTLVDLVDHFLDVTYRFNSKIHRSPFLKLIWGAGFKMDCIMTSADVNYTLFNSEGVPVRTKINASFREQIEPSLWEKFIKLESPDLTTTRAVQTGESLPTLTNEAYDDPAPYIQVARFNKLKSIRRLNVGQELNFPPLRSGKE